MLDVTTAIQNAASIAPRAMNTGHLVHNANLARPENGLADLKELELMPETVSEDQVLDEEERLGEATRAKELVAQLVSLRKDVRSQQVAIYKEGLKDKKNSLDASRKVTQANGEFARFLQSHLLNDRKEERFATGYQRLRSEAVSMF